MKTTTVHWGFQVLFLTAGIGIQASYELHYVSFAAYLFIAVLFHLVSGSHARPSADVGRWHKPEVPTASVDLIPLIAICVWAYGVIVGLYNGNDPEGIARNFAGMTFYLNYFILRLAAVSTELIISALLAAGVINIAIPLSFGAYAILTGDVSTKYVDTAGLLAFRVYYSISQVLVLPFFGMCLAGLLFSLRNIPSSNTLQALLRNTWLLWTSATVCVISGPLLSMAKGLIICYVIVFVTVIFVVAYDALGSALGQRSLVRFTPLTLMVVVLFAAGIIILETDLYEIIVFTFGDTASGNVIREEQRGELVGDFTLLGKGLGATVASGYTRDDLGYGFELNYENLIHKVGIFAALIFAGYFYTVYRCATSAFSRNKRLIGLIGISGMAYLVPAYGNPILFAPSFVAMHTLVLMLLANESRARTSSLAR